MVWHSSKWMSYLSNTNKTNLHIHYDQLLLKSEDKILETLNMNGEIRGMYKGALLVLAIRESSQKKRKLRFRIKSDVKLCMDTLSQHFLLTEYDTLESKIDIRFRNIDEILRNAMTSKDVSSLPLPKSLNNFVRMCLLDPNFLHIVCEVEKNLENLTKKN